MDAVGDDIVTVIFGRHKVDKFLFKIKILGSIIYEEYDLDTMKQAKDMAVRFMENLTNKSIATTGELSNYDLSTVDTNKLRHFI